jgi:hypothetical protein
MATLPSLSNLPKTEPCMVSKAMRVKESYRIIRLFVEK